MCDECDEEFGTEEECRAHEENCENGSVPVFEFFQALRTAIRLLNSIPNFKQDRTTSYAEIAKMEELCKRFEESRVVETGDEFRSVLRDLLDRYRADAGEECYQDDPAAQKARALLERMESHD